MSVCPECENKIGEFQKTFHTIWHSITCKNCGAKLHFDDQSWLKVCAPLRPVFVFPVVFVVAGFWPRIGAYLMLGLGIYTILALIYFFYKVRSVKLVPKHSEKKLSEG